MLFRFLAETSAAVAATRSRKQKIAHLSACIAQLAADELRAGVAFLSGVMPQGRIGLGYAAVREVSAPPANAPSLSLADVSAGLDAIKETVGKGSKQARADRLARILAASTELEQTFVKHLIIGELRQGALEGIMADAIAEAFALPTGTVRRAAMLRGDLAEVAHVAATEGEAGLARFRLQLFQPLQPMLAQTAEGLDGALAKGATAFEWKLDGARVQVHREDDEVRVYTRKLHDVTNAVPEIVAAVRALPVTSLVLDGETLALRDDGSPHPFQTTMRRFGRRLDVERMRAELPLSVFYFDCLHLDGHDLIDAPGTERFAAFESVLPEEVVVPRLVTGDVNAADAFLEQALSRGHEGVMAKSPDAPYEAGRRGAGWMKVKPVHTLDLVVLAAEWGSGRRRGYLSNLHLGAREPETGGFAMLGKTFKGMTDAILAWQTEALQAIALPEQEDDYVVRVRPELVAEIAFDGVQESPQYPAGMALRFARLKRYRDDKTALEADTVDAVRAIFTGSR